MSPPPANGNGAGRLTQQTYVSIGLAVSLLAGAVFMWKSTQDIKDEMLPRVATIETELKSIGRSLIKIEELQGHFATGDDLSALRAVLREHSTIREGLRERLRAVESAAAAIEHRVRELEKDKGK